MHSVSGIGGSIRRSQWVMCKPWSFPIVAKTRRATMQSNCMCRHRIDCFASRLILICAAIFWLGACTPAPSEPKKADSVPAASKSDPLDNLELSQQMVDAVHQAREGLPAFWSAWADNSFGKGDYLVSAIFTNEDGKRAEFLWMTVEARGEGEVTGSLTGVPTVRTDIKPGDRVTVQEDWIVDWMFVPEDGDHKGGFTTSALGTSKK